MAAATLTFANHIPLLTKSIEVTGAQPVVLFSYDEIDHPVAVAGGPPAPTPIG